jgi:hypothetical protein
MCGRILCSRLYARGKNFVMFCLFISPSGFCGEQSDTASSSGFFSLINQSVSTHIRLSFRAWTVVQLVVAVPRKSASPHPENTAFLKTVSFEHCLHSAQKQVNKKHLVNKWETNEREVNSLFLSTCLKVLRNC